MEYVEANRGMACVDCTLMIANGEIDPEASNDRVDEIAEATAGWALGDEENEFSWRPCVCCNSQLGGSRHEAILLEKVDQE